MDQMNVSEFKAVCLRVLERVRQTGAPLEILKNGEPLAVVYPPPKDRRRVCFGALRDTLREPLGDLIHTGAQMPAWEALEWSMTTRPTVSSPLRQSSWTPSY